MRTLVTGAANPVGAAIVQALLDAGHDVRLFGVDAATASRFRPTKGALTWYAGHVATLGSIEPALSERQVLVHAAACDAPGRDRHGHAVHLERGALACRYGAEREQVDDFVAVFPAAHDRRFASSMEAAVETVKGTRGIVNVKVVQAQDPQQAAGEVVAAIQRLPELGKPPGRESDAVTA